MSTEVNCRIARESFPLLFSGTLDDREKSELIDHLSRCRPCREAFDQERALFAVASADQSSNPLGQHPATGLLETYARSPDRLNENDRESIAGHLAECSVCRELATRLKALPADLDDLVEADEIPFIERLDAASAPAPLERRAKTTSVLAWRWLGGLAAAAVIVLAGILVLQRSSLVGPPTARAPEFEFIQAGEVVFLSELKRGDAEKPLLMESGGWIQVGLGFDAFFDQESYTIELQSGSEVLLEERLSQDHSTAEGGLLIRMRTRDLDPGEYSLVLVTRSLTSGRELSRAAYPFVFSRD